MGRARARMLAVIAAVLVARGARAAIVTEVYDDRAAFDARLAGAVQVVTFDDIDTTSMDPIVLAADRWLALGIRIAGEGGQYASRDFGFPDDDPISSAPNAYAPGPMEDTIGGG